MAFPYISREAGVFAAYRSGHANDLPHHTGSPHHSDCTQGDVGHADISSGHEQVPDIARIKAPVWYGVRVDSLAYAYSLEFLSWEVFAISRIGIVEIDIPGRSHAGILIRDSLNDILFCQDMIANQPPRLPLSINICYPAEAAVSDRKSVV